MHKKTGTSWPEINKNIIFFSIHSGLIDSAKYYINQIVKYSVSLTPPIPDNTITEISKEIINPSISHNQDKADGLTENPSTTKLDAGRITSNYNKENTKTTKIKNLIGYLKDFICNAISEIIILCLGSTKKCRKDREHTSKYI